MKKIVFVIAICSTFAGYPAGDYQTGQTKSTLCIACHGPKGISPTPIWPSLAGQHADYLIKQCLDIQKNRGRQAPTMAPILAPLTEQDIADIALFYSKQPRPEGVTPQKYLKRGQQLYRGGDFEKQITACIACHGPKGQGNAEANFPELSGQNADYIILQLQAFKTGTRKNDLNAIMRDISARMSKEDMEAVAHYIAGLF